MKTKEQQAEDARNKHKNSGFNSKWKPASKATAAPLKPSSVQQSLPNVSPNKLKRTMLPNPLTTQDIPEQLEPPKKVQKRNPGKLVHKEKQDDKLKLTPAMLAAIEKHKKK